jgi:hypothetical protein
MVIPKFVPRISVVGWEYWSDVAVARGFRMQRHAVYDGYRVLDAADKCVAAGSRNQCEKEMAYRVSTGLAKPYEGEVVLLLHGVLRSSRNTATLGKRLEEQGFTVVRLDYASTCLPLEKHAENLRSVVSSLDKAKTIHIVAHSMGGLVARTYLRGGSPDPRIKRVVMLGTPNHGAELADMFSDLKLFGFIFGPAGQELCTVKRNGEIDCNLPKGIEAAIVAGGLGRKPGINPLLKADNDGVVTVESTKLPGACDFLRVTAHHGALMRNAQVAEAVARFLRIGKLRADAKTAG